MNKRNMIIAAIIAALLLLNFSIKPYLRNRDVVRTVTNILEHWKSGELTLAMEYWESAMGSPPVYDLVGYHIEKGRIEQLDGKFAGDVIAVLEFSENKIFPSGRRWKFDLIKSRYGWKVVDFRLLEE